MDAHAGGSGDQLVYVFRDRFKRYVVAPGCLGHNLLAGHVFTERNPDLDSHRIKFEEPVSTQVEKDPSILGTSQIKRDFLATRHCETWAAGRKRFHQLRPP